MTAKFLKPNRVCAAVALILGGMAGAQADTISDAVAAGKANLDLRYRYENVDQKNVDKEAVANTLRTRLSYSSGEFSGIRLMLEADNVTGMGDEDFNDTRNGKTEYPIVADPQGSDLNQAYLAYSGMGKTVMKVGRQRINYDNQRFVGGVAWRQNEQTSDAASIEVKAIADTVFNYAYVSSVHRVFGPNDVSGSTTSVLDGGTQFLNARYSGFGFLTIGFYDYRLLFDDMPALENETRGLRFTGTPEFGDGFKLDYTLEFARQHDAGDNSKDYSADYRHLYAALILPNAINLGIGQEVLGADAEAAQGFQTPLATLHKFQGWADKFLNTPATGIEERYISAIFPLDAFQFMLSYHDYDSDIGNIHYGHEWDASASWKIAKPYELMLKYASYTEDEVATIADTKKLWLQFSVAY